MVLSEFLNYFDFDYRIVNGQVRFVDLTGAYLGDIDEYRASISDDGICGMVDRLEVYIKDYVTDDLEEQLVETGVENVDGMNLVEMAEIAKEKDLSCDLDIINCILNPESLEFEKDKIIESFSVGQMYYENDTERYIVLKNICRDTEGIWNFGVYDSEMNYLYDTTAIDVRLARDIINGDIKSVTHEKCLRIEPDREPIRNYYDKNVIEVVVEGTTYVDERFADIIDGEKGDIDCILFLYDTTADIGQFRLKFSDFSQEDERRIFHDIEVPATEKEKTDILQELRVMKPEFFEGVKKKALSEKITEAEKDTTKGVEGSFVISELTRD